MVKASVSAKFPAALLTQSDVGVFTNNEGTQLTADALIGDNVLDVNDASALEADVWLYAMARDGILCLQIASVDAGAKTVTVTRPKDGTTDVDLREGERIMAAVPAVALNQMRVDLIAVETALGAGNFVAANADRVLFLNASGNITTDADFKYVSDQLRLAGTGSTTGILLGGDALIYRSGADVVSLGADALAIDGTTLFEADRDLAVDLVPNADNALDLGSAARRLAEIHGLIFQIEASASDANPVLKASTAGLQMGAGGASALDTTLVRQADSQWKVTGALAGDVRYGMLGAADPGYTGRLATADAQPVFRLTKAGLELGAGGASAPDVLWERVAPDLWRSPNSVDIEELRIVGVSFIESDRDIAVDLIPNADNTLDIGSTTRNWANLYLARDPASVLFMGADGLVTEDTAALVFDATNNTLAVGGNTFTKTIATSTVTPRIYAHGLDAATGAAVLADQHSATAARGPRFYGLRSRGTEASPVIVNSGDTLLQFLAAGYDGGDYEFSSGINFEVDGTPGPSDMPGRIVFLVAADGTATAVAAARIHQDKRLDLLGALQMSGTTLFEADRDLAVDLIPNVDDALDVGSTNRRLAEVHARRFQVESTAGAANPALKASTSGFEMGAGGASALDVRLIRGDANRWDLGANDHLELPAGDIRFLDETTGPILFDASTGNYWRMTLAQDGSGALVTTDLGTSLPAT